MFCNFCAGKLLESYRPPTTQRNAVVYLCENCGLLQTKYGEYTSEYTRSISSGASWGNIRHGKLLRAQDNFQFIINNVDSVRTVLDIGASRGALLSLLHKHYDANCEGIEPDETLIHPDFSWVTAKLEDLTPNENVSYDLICCTHTLEHVDDLSSFLEKVRQVCHNNSYLFFEVPNTDIINDDVCYQEYFIDKHTFHFTEKTLDNILQHFGFSIFKTNHTKYNLSYLLQINQHKTKIHSVSLGYLTEVITRMHIYKNNQGWISKRLQNVAHTVNSLLNKQRVVLWGSNSILDALCQQGLNVDRCVGIVDDYVSVCNFEYRGHKIKHPSQISLLQPDIIIVLARMSTDKIKEKAIRYTRNVITLEDLIDSCN